MAAVAAAAEQKSASLEAAMQGQENIYEDEIACLATEIEQVSSALIRDLMRSKPEKIVLAAVRLGLTHRACCSFIVSAALCPANIKGGFAHCCFGQKQSRRMSQIRLRTRTWWRSCPGTVQTSTPSTLMLPMLSH